jgi:endogenous inhibitor of DNA gyrase (YacG/DUF329 family)
MSERPRCPMCDKPLAKRTTTVFYPQHARPKTRAEAQRLTNLEIVSLHRGHADSATYMSANVWDGKSYGPARCAPFCTNNCAIHFGIAAHRDGARRIPTKRS